ncbi:nuclear transport factor 2 family protein [Stackebrandtia nassauensis]|uniref:Phenazine biosynthesis protein n=1 Tax=Stackebrandtia nassauensis (strain DSM 44728 / CIP 108903 / NRRL B-16338 / NBRC 102104 / LLR-40K-21) TaxID=446470 RepID=D3Q5Y4_STANL|nr:nuclear transport factor 2 family protein [Stackebrandtia nassauensis]ADD40283.1 phenazine biosynthesis protein [Stackebrandtia nassauensis DSM 44728]
MTHPSPRQVWEACVNAAITGDIAAQTAFYAEDAVLEFPFLFADGLPNRFEGRAAIGEFFAAMQSGVGATGVRVDRENSTLTLHDTTDPEVLIAEIELAVEPAGTSRYVQVVRVRDGQIVSMRDYFAGAVTGIVTGILREAR